MKSNTSMARMLIFETSFACIVIAFVSLLLLQLHTSFFRINRQSSVTMMMKGNMKTIEHCLTLHLHNWNFFDFLCVFCSWTTLRLAWNHISLHTREWRQLLQTFIFCYYQFCLGYFSLKTFLTFKVQWVLFLNSNQIRIRVFFIFFVLSFFLH